MDLDAYLNTDVLEESNLEKDVFENDKIKEETDTLTKEIVSLQEDILKEKTAKENTVKRSKELETKILKLQTEIGDRDRKIIDQETFISDLEKRKHQHVEELEFIKRKQYIQVQLLCKEEDEVKKSVRKELVSAIKDKRNDKGWEIEMVECMKASDIQYGIPLLLCVKAPSAAQGLLNALKGIKVSPKLAVILVHIQTGRADTLPLGDQMCKIKGFESIGGIFDIVFTKEERICQCPMSDTSIVGILDFISTAGARKPLKDNSM